MMRYESYQMKKSRNSLPLLGGSATSSPFYIPPDENIFDGKEDMYKTKRQQLKEKNKLKIWERPAPKKGLTMKDLNQIGSNTQTAQTSFSMNYPLDLVKATKLSLQNNLPKSQPVQSFLRRKRQILLLQMRINNKRQQITKLQESNKKYQQGLRQVQNCLSQDVNNFNIYLNQNKLEVRSVIKNSEEKTKVKNQMIRLLKQKLEIKTDYTGRINSKIEVLENLIKYKLFFNKLSVHKTANNKVDIHKNHSEQLQYLIKNFSMSTDLLYYLSNQNNQEEENIDGSKELMSVFIDLEEANLSCITSLKDIQQKMEVVKFNYKKKKQKMTTEKIELMSDRAQLIKQLAIVEKQIDFLKGVSNEQQKQIESLGLQKYLYQAYQQNDLKQVPPQFEFMPLQLLKQIEKKLQFLVKHMQDSRAEKPLFMQTLQKNCFLQKRQKKKQKVSEPQQKCLARQASFEQSKLATGNRKRRVIMYKSKLNSQNKQQKQVDNQPDEQQIQRRKYFS